jgi:hypothetical protein
MLYQQENFANKNLAMNLSFNISGGKFAPQGSIRKAGNFNAQNTAFSVYNPIFLSEICISRGNSVKVQKKSL